MPAPPPRPRGLHALRRGQGRGSRACSGEQGFLLPLAFGTSLLLLLGSLSLQGLVLQGRLGLRRAELRAQQEDALASAAQQLVAVLNLRHPCLLALPLQHWSREGLSCASGSAQQNLAQGSSGEVRWRLIDWQPALSGARLLIELEARAPDLPGRQGSFAVALLAEPLRAQPPRLLALRGVAP